MPRAVKPTTMSYGTDWSDVKTKPDDPLSPDNLRDLFRVAGKVSDDPGDQVWLVVHAIKAGVNAEALALRLWERGERPLWSDPPVLGPPVPEGLAS